jgi:hypothetical protein
MPVAYHNNKLIYLSAWQQPNKAQQKQQQNILQKRKPYRIKW